MRLTRKSSQPAGQGGLGISRRQFLQRSGVATGGLAAAGFMGHGMMQAASAKEKTAYSDAPVETKRTICSHCSVGCGVYAEVQEGVWTKQEPAFDHPINRGAHCAKGASLREHGHSTRRLKYPMKLVDGQWQRLEWDQAIEEIGDKVLELRDKHGPDSVYWLGSAKFNNEQAYLMRKLAALWGTNNTDHQARICHSTTVAGVANTWGYGAMTNSLNDIQNSKSILFIGSNPSEAHPVAMQHILLAKERNNAQIIVVDPRFTRTAAKSDKYVRLRPGSDVAYIWGLLWHIFENGWEDTQFIEQRVYGMDKVRSEVANFPPDVVESITGVGEADMYDVAKRISENRPGCVVWCMGGTQHTTGNNNTRAYCILELALGNLGVSGGGANIFRGHDNVQGATDLGLMSHSLPGYYGLSEGAWKHWSKIWNVDYEWIKNRFDPNEYNGSLPMNSNGITVSRWIDGVLEEDADIAQRSSLKGMFYWGHAVNSQTRGPEMKKAMSQLELMVVVDPYPTVAAVMNDRTDGVYLLPAATQFETTGSVTATNRALQWRDQVIEPMFDSKPDHEIMYLMAQKLGFGDEFTRNFAIENGRPVIEDVLREINAGMWTVGYTGQSPERLKAHQKNWHTFDFHSMQALGGPIDGDYYGLPWPCWGTAEFGHPGTPLLYDMSKPVKEGGLTFRARFGVEHDGVNLLADGVASAGSEIKDGYPEFTADMLKQLGWWDDLTAEEKKAAEGKNWKTDLSGGIQRVAIEHGCAPFGNAKARCEVWTFPDPIPKHREPLYTPRRDLVEKYPTWDDVASFYRLPTLYRSIQENDFSQEFPIILTSGRLVEYEGGGEETRSMSWLAELQQEMFVEINPAQANDLGIKNDDMVWVHGPEGGKVKVKAMVTPRVARDVAFMPFHFGGIFQGESLADKYPEGARPYVLGEAANTATTYGYDIVTQMQETKCTLCRIEKASA
ncbi:formate dehydrogenase alpha subunit [Chromohalobacter marismortui]|uniref:Formate dehydrogenase alpha subunit n=1 Tax=Chromohalobacter marismortui TaxID=42055 RepID=A0A4R7NPB8_9GAMM|nr:MULTISPECIES: formate dehydrogenase subunit alpha [Chromohalobacter]MCI0508901.1 formate dehydrogenase subunit alpha [Chromohalobacter sp.]MCI0594242.1 formate dehydrogenase subunit alpha [Chromohalobacter sp.]TDU22724.1 formate dehydrogenase alpha subunit [Chromohalobacter marismortui]